MSNSSAGQWVKFFNASGIPSPAAATYAHIFVENRIQTDMLMDLNKEYLREMCITPMGDIIAILRHAKHACDQSARERVLCSEVSVPVATVTAHSVAAPPISKQPRSQITPLPTSARTVTKRTSSAAVIVPEKTSKRETTTNKKDEERKKALKATLYSERETEKPDVFDRLAMDQKPPNVINLKDEDMFDTHKASSSIFARLGKRGLAINTQKQTEDRLKPILKHTNKTLNSDIVKAKFVAAPKTSHVVKKREQKVMLVHKVPVKIGSEDEDDDVDNNHDYASVDSMNSSSESTDMDVVPISEGGAYGNTQEKIVKFASTAEVREIAPAPRLRTPPARNHNFGKRNTIKDRLGITNNLHTTKRTYNLKKTNINFNSRTSPVKGKTLRLKSDEILVRGELPVHKRLGNGIRAATSNIYNKHITEISQGIRRVDFKERGDVTSRTKYNKIRVGAKNNASVFDRLAL